MAPERRLLIIQFENNGPRPSGCLSYAAGAGTPLVAKPIADRFNVQRRIRLEHPIGEKGDGFQTHPAETATTLGTNHQFQFPE